MPVVGPMIALGRYCQPPGRCDRRRRSRTTGRSERRRSRSRSSPSCRAAGPWSSAPLRSGRLGRPSRRRSREHRRPPPRVPPNGTATSPPSNGTSGSAVPEMTRTETGRAGRQDADASTPRVPATSATAIRRSASSRARRPDIIAPLLIPMAKIRSVSTGVRRATSSRTAATNATSSMPSAIWGRPSLHSWGHPPETREGRVWTIRWPIRTFGNSALP